MAVPFLGRLHPIEYLALVGSFFLVGLEALIRVATLALPPFLVSLFYRASRRLFNRFSTPAQKRAESRHKSISTSVRDASDFVELCRIWGYEAEEHIVQTKDGYLLGLHRLQWRKGEESQKVNAGPNSLKKRVAYLHHGLLMNSEVWVCLTDEQRCLPFELVNRGFDVWFGNNRGNKYSKKSIHTSPTSTKFWDFSMDEFAFHDIPDSISYILDTTQQESLSYIGFSQGTAQAFATLAIHPKLNNQVNVFIALAPAMAPAGLSNGIVDSLVKASPSVLFLLFGRRSILSSATMWETLLYPPIFTRLIDLSLSFLFNWSGKNISTSQKLGAYPHLYSFTSTKSVVHWFQIIRNKCFQMYDDDVHQPMSVSKTSKYSKVARYPTRNIKTPVVLVYGGSDSLVDIKIMLKELPPQTVATEIPHYEHLDFLWARDVDAQVFQHVFDALDSFTDAEHSKEEYDKYYVVRQESLIGSGYAFAQSQRESESESSTLAPSTDGVSLSHPHRAREYLVTPTAKVPSIPSLQEESIPPSPANTERTLQALEPKPTDSETEPFKKPKKNKKDKHAKEKKIKDSEPRDEEVKDLEFKGKEPKNKEPKKAKKAKQPKEPKLLEDQEKLEGGASLETTPIPDGLQSDVAQEVENDVLPTPPALAEESSEVTSQAPKKKKKKEKKAKKLAENEQKRESESEVNAA